MNDELLCTAVENEVLGWRELKAETYAMSYTTTRDFRRWEPTPLRETTGIVLCPEGAFKVIARMQCLGFAIELLSPVGGLRWLVVFKTEGLAKYGSCTGHSLFKTIFEAALKAIRS